MEAAGSPGAAHLGLWQADFALCQSHCEYAGAKGEQKVQKVRHLRTLAQDFALAHNQTCSPRQLATYSPHD
jgi:hypothetical protein